MMTHWYLIGFYFVMAVFIIKYLVSWIFGDVDVDFDIDGDIDFDISSMLSFKGVLHFFIGFFGYLSVIARFSPTYVIDEPYKFSTGNYMGAIICGIIFMIILWYAYNITAKFSHENTDMPDFTNCEARILANNGNGTYEVLIFTSAGSYKKTVRSGANETSIEVGSVVRILKINNEYVI